MSDYLLSNFRKLQTENIGLLKDISIADADVLTLAEDQRVRLTNLSKATSLAKSKTLKTYITIKDVSGNLHKFQLNIIGFNHAETFTDNGYAIPLKAIYSVDFL